MTGLKKGIYEFDTKVVYDDSYIQTVVTKLVGELRGFLKFDGNVPESGILKGNIYVCTLSGAVQFFHDVTKQLPSGLCEYVKASSYVNNQRTDCVNIQMVSSERAAYSQDVRNIIIFDDICDTGNTLDGLVRFYHKNHPTARISTAVLIYRERPDSIYKPNFSGITTDSVAWFAGYGLDNNGYDRNLPYIYELPQELNTATIKVGD